MLSLPQAWAGAMIALFIAQEPLSLIAMIGIVLLNAIVNKNAILLVDYTNTLRARGYKRTGRPAGSRPGPSAADHDDDVHDHRVVAADGAGAGARRGLPAVAGRRHDRRHRRSRWS